MSIGPGPYFLALFGTLNDMIPLATSPVANYKAPDALSSWTALGIHGYVMNYNERLSRINERIQGSYQLGRYVTEHSPSDPQYEYYKEHMEWHMKQGLYACFAYLDYLAATRDSLVAGCKQLGVPLPRHGSTAGMKPVYTLGMDIPTGSYQVS